MKAVVVIACFLFITVNIYAQKEWIVIEPINSDENSKKSDDKSKQNIKISPFQPVQTLLENAKVIQHLLDNKNDKEEPKADSEKNWYIIKNMENNR